MNTLSTSVAGGDARIRARRGLAVFFAVLVPLSAIFQAITIATGNASWILALMWSPAAASVVARLALREGFADVSFRFEGRRTLRYLLLAPIFPIAIGLIAYSIAWTTGLARFAPQPLGLVAPLVGEGASPLTVFVVTLALAATVGTVLVVPYAAGEEIGWRGYMLTRLIDAGVLRPILASGVIWGLWHVPLILAGMYVAGSSPVVTAVLFMVAATSFCFVIARMRLETGSIWPAVALHAAWNSIIQSAFGVATTGAVAALWVGEAGILTALVLVVAAVIFSRGTWTYVRRLPERGVPLSQRLAQKPARVTQRHTTKGRELYEAKESFDAPVACHRPCARARRGPTDRRRRRGHDELRGRFLRLGRHRRGPQDLYGGPRHRLSHRRARLGPRQRRRYLERDDRSQERGSRLRRGRQVHPGVCLRSSRNHTSGREAVPSTPVEQPTSAKPAAADLHALLRASGEPGPYVLVGHSFGGDIVRLYAGSHPAEVGGLVDALSEDLPNGLTPRQEALFEKINAAPPGSHCEYQDTSTTFKQLRESPPAPTVPTVVLTADRSQLPLTKEALAKEQYPAGVNQEFTNDLWASQLAAQDKLAKKFPGAEYITDTNSSHYIQVANPQLVSDSIRQVVEAERAGAKRQSRGAEVFGSATLSATPSATATVSATSSAGAGAAGAAQDQYASALPGSGGVSPVLLLAVIPAILLLVVGGLLTARLIRIG